MPSFVIPFSLSDRLLAPRMVPEGGIPLWCREFSLHLHSHHRGEPPDHLQQVHSPVYAGSTPSQLRVQTGAQKGMPGQKILTSHLLAPTATTIQAWCSGSVHGDTTSATTPGMSVPLECCGSGVVSPQSATTTLTPLPVWCCGSGVVDPQSATTPGKTFPLECCGSELVSPPLTPGGWQSVKYLGPSDRKLVGGWCSEVCPLEHHSWLSQLVETDGRGNVDVSTSPGVRESPLGARVLSQIPRGLRPGLPVDAKA